MDDNLLHILLVEDNSTDVLLLEEALEEVRPTLFALTRVKRLDEALALPHHKYLDVVLLDLGLPDSQGLDTFARMQREHPTIPVLILSGLDNEALAVRAVQDGAQDFLVKGKINGRMLSRTLRYAIERKRAEQKLIASETGYRRLFETTQDGIIILDANTGQITDANPCLENLLGFTHAEFVGKRLWELPAFRHKTASLVAFRTLKEQSVIRYDALPLLAKDGRQVDVEFVSNVYEAGNQRVVQCNIHDITESKRAEAAEQELQRFQQSTLDALSSHIAVLDENGKILAVNNAWRQFSEENQGTDETCGVGANYIQVCDWADGPHSEEAPTLSQGLREIMAGQHEAFCLEYPCHSPQEERWFNVCVTRFEGSGPVRVVVAHENITERKQAEQKLRESELRFQSIVANTPGTVYQFVCRPDGSVEIPFVNEGCREIFEIEPEELQRNPNFPIQIIHPDDRAQQEESVLKSAETLDPWSCEWRIRLPSGVTKWVQGAGRPRRLPDGGTLWDGLLMDITARKEAEEERDRFFTLSLDMLALIGSDGYMKRLNPAFETTLGYSNAELMAVPFLEFVHPDDHAATVDGAARLQSGANVTEFENRYRCRDGSYKWLRWTCAPFEELWYCVAHDITDVKQAAAALQKANDQLELHVAERTAELSLANEHLQLEMAERRRADESLYKSHEFLEAVLENTAEGIVACDAEGQLTFFNRATREFHGLPLESVPVEQWAQHYSLYAPDGTTPMHPEDVPLFQALSGEHVRNMEMRIVPRQGSPRLLIANGEPLFDADGNKLGAVVVMHDITRRKQAETEISQLNVQLKETNEKLRLENIDRHMALGALHETTQVLVQAKQEAEQARQNADAANLAKSEFLSRMSHELRTPLNAILGFGQILDRQVLAPLSKESVGYILKGGRHLLDLINEVLDIARVEAGHLELSLEPIALDDVVPEACALVRPLACERGIHLHEDVLEPGCNYILADRQRLKQVLLNLLSNAIKYNHEGGRVEVCCEQKPDGWACIAVRDTGPGISPQDLPKLFVPFERLGASSSEVEGTGLGLVLSQRMVVAMGGTLSVESTLGQGTTFTICLPQATSPAKQLGEVSEGLGRADTKQESGRAHSVLCIEDNPSNLHLMEAIFELRPQIALLTAVQGSIGLDMARQHEPDLILLDLNLPDMHGKDVMARLQQSAITRDIPIVVISADATPGQVKQLLAAGARDYLTKPLDVDLFLCTLDKFLSVTPATSAQSNNAVEVV
jgi:PAS domain S-box-containing protein